MDIKFRYLFCPSSYTFKKSRWYTLGSAEFIRNFFFSIGFICYNSLTVAALRLNMIPLDAFCVIWCCIFFIIIILQLNSPIPNSLSVDQPVCFLKNILLFILVFKWVWKDMKVSKSTLHFLFFDNLLSEESWSHLGFFEAPAQMFFYRTMKIINVFLWHHMN